MQYNILLKIILTNFSMYRKIEYIVAILLILECNTVYSNSIYPGGIYSIGTFSLTLLLCYFNLKSKVNNIENIKTITFFILYFIGIIILFFNSNSTFRISYISKFILLLPTFIYYIATIPNKKYKFNLLYAISNVMLIEAIISIIFFTLGTCFSIIPASQLISINWGNLTLIPSWYNIYFEPQLFRNSGIFVEAPMHNFCLTIAFLTEAFLKEKKSKFKITTLVIAILTSLSTTGQLAIIGTIGISLLNNKRRLKNTSLKLKILISFLSIGLIILMYYVVDYILELKAETASFEIRQDFIKQGLEAWKTHPILGCGYGTNGDGSSNSIIVLLAEGGIMMFSLYILSFIIIPFLYWKRKINKNLFYFYIIYFGVFCITIILYSNITLFTLSITLSIFIKKQNSNMSLPRKEITLTQ